MNVLVSVREALQIKIQLGIADAPGDVSEMILQGSSISIDLVVREDGDLNSDSQTVAIQIFPVDENQEITGAVAKEALAALSTRSDGSVRAGQYKATIPVPGLTAGKYVARALVPFGNGTVIGQQIFDVVDPNLLANLP